MHALITAASNPRLTRDEALAIDHAYMPVCALATLLDGLVDHISDAAGGEYSYICTYESHEQLTRALVRLGREAMQLNRHVRRRAGHVMTLTGVVAYYATAPGADTEFARPAIDALQAQLGGIATPAIALIRRRRQAKWRIDPHDRRTLAQIDEPASSH
jgi:tetraprenyl-beta-curcumene synthase